jgi:hypothetical protein|tara:strand:- start:243 stop:551 length:309 start_codon:yes stop_codon:yes gene_type:complete
MEMDKDIPIEQKLNLWQDEYFELLINVLNHNEGMITQDKTYTYYWERLKVLQKYIVVYSFIERERKLEEAKEALEEAFTPRIKELLENRINKEVGDEDGKKI